jgi:apolipoprotein N-acyltransferase
LFDRDMNMLASYDKFHLVPFGEFIPFQKYMPFGPFVQFTGFATGPGPRTLTVPGMPPFSPLVCYEIIFPGNVADTQSEPRPAFILNVTNDAWYGDSPGPRQHFMQARFRAIEEGLPIIRSANTGVSGVIDSFGRIDGEINLGNRGALISLLPRAGVAPYAKMKDLPFFILVSLLLLLPIILRKPY